MLGPGFVGSCAYGWRRRREEGGRGGGQEREEAEPENETTTRPRQVCLGQVATRQPVNIKHVKHNVAIYMAIQAIHLLLHFSTSLQYAAYALVLVLVALQPASDPTCFLRGVPAVLV